MNAGVVVWFTGLPASGKTTLAQAVRDRLVPDNLVVLLDSDAVRPTMAPDLGFDGAGRDEFYRRLAQTAAHLAGQGRIVLVSATAPRRVHRDRARGLAPRFIEVFVDTGVDECAARDPKGLYAGARRGEVHDLPGVGTRYEQPESPDVTASGGFDQPAIDMVVARVLLARRTGPMKSL